MSIPVFGQFVIAVLGLNVVTQKARGLLVGMGDQSLFLGEFELECLLQVRAQLVLDLLCFCPRSRQTEQHVVCVADIS